MAEFIKLSPDTLRQLRTVDERLVSYNVEMTEVTGGTFWKAYSPEEIAGTKPFEGPVGSLANHTAMAALMQFYPPIDLKSEKLRKLAKDIGPAWVRVSGTWSTKTYYDFDGKMGGKSPEGYQNVLTRDQWLGVLDFCRDIGAKLMISVANCAGLHSADEPWNPSQAEQIFALSKEYGVPIDAAEFMNEPNMLAMSGAPEGYTAANFVRDQDLFNRWLHENYPGCLAVGPCSTVGIIGEDGDNALGGGIADVMPSVSTDELMDGATEPMECTATTTTTVCRNVCSPSCPWLTGPPKKPTPRNTWRLPPAWPAPTHRCVTVTCPAARCGSPSPAMRAAATPGLPPTWMCCAP